MGFYFGQARSLRKEFMDAYGEGVYDKAAILGERLLRTHEENNETKSMEYAIDTHNLALVLEALTLTDKAIKYYKRAATLKLEAKGETISYADTLNNLGVIYSEEGNYTAAVEVFRKVLEIRDLKLGRCHEDYVHALYNLANTYAEMGQVDRALDLHTKALQRAQGCKGIDSLELADINNAIGFCYDEKGNYKKSIAYYETTLDLIEKARGVNTYYYMVTMLSLAGVCEKSGFLSLAVEYCERAIAIRSKIMTEGQIDFVTNRNYLATICYKDGQFDRALKYHLEILDQITEILGEKHLLHAEVLGSIATDYLGKKDYETALTYARKAYMEKQALLELEDIHITGSMMVMGAIYIEMGAFVQAFGWYTLALEKRIRTYGEESPLTADTYCAIAQAFAKQGLLEGALSCLFKALEIRQGLGEGQEDFILWILHNMAELKQQQGESEGAVHFALLGQRIAKQRWGEEHPKYAKALVHLSKAYEGANDFERALLPLEEALAVQGEVLDEDNPAYLKTMEALAQLHFLRKAYEQAIHFYRERNDVNFEETPTEQRAAATTLMAIANCCSAMGDKTKAKAYAQEAGGRLKRSKLAPDDAYEKEYTRYLHLQGLADAPEERGAVLHMSEEMRLYLEEGFEKGLNKTDATFTGYLCAMVLGEYYEGVEALKEAEQWYQQAKSVSEDMCYVFACRRLGQLYLRMGMAQRAIRPLVNAKEYLEEYGDTDTEAYYGVLGYLGDALFQINRLEQALGFYGSWRFGHFTLELPDTQRYLQRLECLGDGLWDLGRKAESLAYYNLLATALSKKEARGQRQISVLLKIAMVHTALGETVQAEEVLDRCLLLGGGFGTESDYFRKLSHQVGQMYDTLGLRDKGRTALGWANEDGVGAENSSKEGLFSLE